MRVITPTGVHQTGYSRDDLVPFERGDAQVIAAVAAEAVVIIRDKEMIMICGRVSSNAMRWSGCLFLLCGVILHFMNLSVL